MTEHSDLTVAIDHPDGRIGLPAPPIPLQDITSNRRSSAELDEQDYKPLLRFHDSVRRDTTPFNMKDECYACWNYRSVNLFWFEKGYLLLQFAQLYGVLWWCGQDWGFPSQWQSRLWFTVLFNVDIAVYMSDPSFSLYYLLAWCALPLLILGVGFVHVMIIRITVGTISFDLAFPLILCLGQGYLASRARAIRVYHTMLELIAIPWALHAFRTISCSCMLCSLSPFKVLSVWC